MAPKLIFVNNYFKSGLLARQANMDILPVFNEYKAATYMCSYFSKSKDECSLAMRQPAKEAFESNLSNYKTMQGVVRAYVNKRECSVPEVGYIVCYMNYICVRFSRVCSNIPGKRIRILKSERVEYVTRT